MPPSDATHLHPATPRKRQRARAEGHVAKSTDLISAMVLIGGLTSILLFGDMWLHAVLEVTQQRLGGVASSQVSIGWLEEFVGDFVNLFILFLIPATFLFVGLPLVIHLLQTRFLFHFTSALPNWSRMGFAQWKHRTFNVNHLMYLIFNLGKLLVVFAFTIWFFIKRGPELVALAATPSESVALSLSHLLMRFVIEISIALVVLSLLDLLYQRRKYEREIMMTEEELREESRNR